MNLRMRVTMKMMYPNMLLNDGIMSDLNDFNVPWRDDIDNINLDLGYYQHSAQKLVSPLIFDISGVKESIKNFEPIVPLNEQQRTLVAGTIFNLFHRKWNRLYNVYLAEYNPIENYSMTENETIGKDISRAGSDTGTITNADTGTIADSGTDTGTITNSKTGTISNNGTETGTITNVLDEDITNTGTQQNAGTSNTENGIFGFSSSQSVGSDTSDNTSSSTRTDNLASTKDSENSETRNLTTTNTETNNLTEQETRQLANGNTRTLNTNNQETRNLATSETISDDTERQLTRSGNIGVTTSQQMLQSDIDLWQWNFFKQVFEDIDSILCLSVY